MRLKKLISYILLTIWLPILCLPLCGFTADGEVSIKHSGKGEATFFIDSDLEKDAFQQKIEAVVQDLNDASISNDGSNDIVKLKGIEEENGLYEVNVSFRRIDKVDPRGIVYLYKAESLKVEQSEEWKRLERWERGDINCTSTIFYNQLPGLVQIKKTREGGPKLVIKPKSAAGETLSVKNFAEQISEKDQILSFQLLDTLGVEKIQISLPGKITYCGDNVTIIDKSTFEIKPTTVPAQVTRNSTDSYESIVTNEEIQIFVGYVAFQKSISPFTITVLTIVGLMVVGLVAYSLYYFYQRGKKVQALEEAKKELENERECTE